MIAETPLEPFMNDAVELKQRDYSDSEPVSQDVLAAYKEQLTVSHVELNAETKIRRDSDHYWREERIVMDAGYDDQKIPVYCFIPMHKVAPYDPVIVFPGLQGWMADHPLSEAPEVERELMFESLVKSGRAAIWPIFDGSYERFNDYASKRSREYYEYRTSQIKHWRQELATVIDFLESRDDFSGDRVGFFGTSFGSTYTWPLLALEKRIKTAIMVSGGVPQHKEPGIADSFNYLPEVNQPILLLHGKFDPIYTRPLIEPVDRYLGGYSKRVLFDAGHWPLPRSDYIRETTDWLDTYLSSDE